MPHLGQAFPAEEKKADKGGFQKEGHETFKGQRRTEYVADVMGVISPIRAELKLHGDASGDTHGEIDSEEQSPESCDPLPDFPSRHDVNGFRDHQNHGKPERQRHEQEVIQRSERELQPRERDNVQIDHERAPRKKKNHSNASASTLAANIHVIWTRSWRRQSSRICGNSSMLSGPRQAPANIP